MSGTKVCNTINFYELGVCVTGIQEKQRRNFVGDVTVKRPRGRPGKESSESGHKPNMQANVESTTSKPTQGKSGEFEPKKRGRPRKAPANNSHSDEKCTVCTGADSTRDDKLMLCDGKPSSGGACQNACHMKCANLSKVPRGSWLCFECQGVICVS